MATVNFSVPEDVKQAFNAAFAGQNKSALLTQLMRDAVAQAEAQRRRQAAAKRLLGRHDQAPERSAHALDRRRRDERA